MLKLLNVKVSLGIYIETCWWMITVGLIGILLACGSSSIDENHEQNVEPPDLTDIIDFFAKRGKTSAWLLTPFDVFEKYTPTGIKNKV